MDAGYALNWYSLTPYRGVRYHLKEWKQGNLKPQNARELFNMRHSQLRNAVERAFRIVKKRFPILVLMSSYPLDVQTKLIKSCFMIHNFIRKYQDYDDDYEMFDDELLNDNEPMMNFNIPNDGEEEIENLRDEIAEHMWQQYEFYQQL